MELAVQKIQTLRHATRLFVEGAQFTKECNEADETKILADYALKHRKYPEGHTFTYDGQVCTLGRSLAYYHEATQAIMICYAVKQNGIEFDTIREIHVDNPHNA